MMVILTMIWILTFINHAFYLTYSPAGHVSHYHTTKPLTLELEPCWSPVIRGFKSPFPMQ
jgi:hypothetical protein